MGNQTDSIFPTWLYKLGGRAYKQYWKKLCLALFRLNAFNAGKKRDLRRLELLSRMVPDVEEIL